MDTIGVLFAIWGLVTVVLFGLMFYRSRITKKETDWIPLSEDAKEEKAIESQKVSETKSHKLDLPIRVLAIVSLVMLLVIFGLWLYHGIMTPPPIAK